MEEKRNAYAVLVGKPRCRWEDNIKTDLKEIGWEVVAWLHAQDWNQPRALVYTVMNFRFQ
jgi:hypothetical protein